MCRKEFKNLLLTLRRHLIGALKAVEEILKLL